MYKGTEYVIALLPKLFCTEFKAYTWFLSLSTIKNILKTYGNYFKVDLLHILLFFFLIVPFCEIFISTALSILFYKGTEPLGTCQNYVVHGIRPEIDLYFRSNTLAPTHICKSCTVIERIQKDLRICEYLSCLEYFLDFQFLLH